MTTFRFFHFPNCPLIYGLMMALLPVFTASGQQSQATPYLDQAPPGNTPKKFAAGLISKNDEYEFGSVFTADGNEFFYGVDVGGRAEIRYTRLEEGRWREPAILLQSDTYGYNDPFLSPDETKLYFISNQPLQDEGPPKDIDIWYIEKQGHAWSAPINAGAPVNSPMEEYYISFTNKGILYFASNVHAEEGRSRNFDIYRAVPSGNSYAPPVALSKAINSPGYEADAFIAYDESYIIFSAGRREGLGEGDLYVSFRNENNVWSKAQNMGALINTAGHELCPFVTKDGRYFFYTSNKDIYWIETDAALTALRETAIF
ncbi:MAG: hypothetical protein AB8G77_23350 [Rhodothermales bacterium]